MKCKYCKNEAIEGRIICLECREKRRTYDLEYNKRNREKRAEYARNYRKQYPDRARASNQKKDKEKKKIYNKQYRAEHSAELKKYKREKHQREYPILKLVINARNAYWSKMNKEKQCDRVARYRARKINAFIAHVDSLTIYNRDGWVCKICGGPVNREANHKHPEYPTIDHIVPLSRGGKHCPENVQCAHLRCNQSKGNKLPEDLNQ